MASPFRQTHSKCPSLQELFEIRLFGFEPSQDQPFINEGPQFALVLYDLYICVTARGKENRRKEIMVDKISTLASKRMNLTPYALASFRAEIVLNREMFA